MRLLALLLAMYVLVLSGVPCEALCQHEATTASGPGTIVPADHPDECKNCSPFSLCAAGVGFTVPTAVQAEPPAPGLPAPSPSRGPRYRARHTIQVAARIWQPPRAA